MTACPFPKPRILWYLAAAAFGLTLWYLHYQIVQPYLMPGVPDWPVMLTHMEATSLSTAGKWGFAGGYPSTDAFSGQFPIFYNYVSDLINNFIGKLVHLPPMVVQSVWIGPFLGCLFFFLNFVSLDAVLVSPPAAFVASALISVMADPKLPVQYSPWGFESYKPIFHVPILSLALDTAQSMGWVLLLPSLTVMHFAWGKRSPKISFFFGILLGILMQTHSLTFVNVMTAAAIYLLILRPNLKLILLTALGGLLASGWYISFVLTHFGAIGMYGHFLGVEVPIHILLFFYSPFILPALFGIYRLFVRRPGSRYAPHSLIAIWVASLLIGTLILAFNHQWGWKNHPYRFMINLIFPLSILAGLGVIEMRKRAWGAVLAAPVLIWFCTASYLSLAELKVDPRLYVNYGRLQKGDFVLLKSLRERTDGAHSILVPPDRQYPFVSHADAMLLNYSKSPSYLPDNRYIFWQQRYFNRMRLFCRLFPGFPDSTSQGGVRPPSCQFEVNAGAAPAIILPKGRVLENAILHASGIRYVAAMNASTKEPVVMTRQVDEAARMHRWREVARGETGVLYEVPVVDLPGVATHDGGVYASSGFSESLITPFDGEMDLVLAGAGLDRYIGSVILDGKMGSIVRRNDGSLHAHFSGVTLGKHRLEIRPPQGSWLMLETDGEYLSFISAVQSRYWNSYFEELQ